MATDASAALLSGYRVAAEQTGFAPHDTKSQGACQIQSEGSAIAQGKGVGRKAGAEVERAGSHTRRTRAVPK